MSTLENWREEKRSAFLYDVIAKEEKDPVYSKLFRDLKNQAESQAQIWLRTDEKFTPDPRARLVAKLIKAFGPRKMRPILAAMKVRGMSIYSAISVGHAMPGSVEELGQKHSGAGAGGNLRAAVFGANDGLVSNASLILGIAGASNDPKIVLLSGIAGLMAGAFSMAAGEFISVRSQRDLFEYQIGLERDELQKYPKEEAAELALIFQARGFPKEDAERLSFGLVANPEKALNTLAKEELGLDPEELGSPGAAALYSFLSFAAGAIIPLFPFLFIRGPHALMTSIIFTAIALFGIGAVTSLFTGKKAIMGGLRMLLVGGAAGAATHLIGKFLGVTLN